MADPIVHFEIPADNVKRAKKFYEKIFGWEITRYSFPGGGYWIVRTTEVDKDRMPKRVGAINGGLMQRKTPDQPFMNYIHVNSIENFD
ncbi:hypothetical protein HZB01_05395 [Candidatus Woesearchaeota archaeon]|nr:hypothetical protein [Candidatus Woesearchaeota archaeon]